MNISIALAVYNEEKNLSRCLSSIVDIADEIIVVDGGSTDGTVSIAKKFNAKIIKTDNPKIFHINKQKALDACSGIWILQLDADEVITQELKKEIITVIQSDSMHNGFFISRRNYFWGYFMKKGGQYPDAVIRLVRRGTAEFPCKSVHEQITVEGNVGTLTHPMEHYSYQTRSSYWKKADIYTSLTAIEIQKDNMNVLMKFLKFCIVKPTVTFFSIYIRHKGFIDRFTGLEFSLYSALHFPWAYYKSLGIKDA